MPDSHSPHSLLREMYPGLSEAELAQVEIQLERYAALILRITERVASYPQAGSWPPENGTLPCTPPPEGVS